MSNFKSTFEQLKAEQEALNQKIQAAKKEAIEHIQSIINEFNITQEDLYFAASGEKAKRTHSPAAPMYRTPDGIEWTGKGLMKREIKAYLEASGKTLEDIKINK